jgi:tRNA(Ile)-lysidine synthase
MKSMKYLVAVSGGVDSVVLLDMLARRAAQEPSMRLIVAHVDHGIRDDSANDARFVAELAKRYHLPFISNRFELGPSASEDRARQVRYGFLFEQASLFGAKVVTAHHLGDVVETVAINLARGTGWRGLAVLNRPGVWRPLLSLSKSKLYDYALAHRLEWVEDSTNVSDRYQRNRLRRSMNTQLGTGNRIQLAELRLRQLQLSKAIEHETDRLLASHSGSRYFQTQVDATVALELLGRDIMQQTGLRPTRPQLMAALHAVKTAAPRTTHQVGGGIELTFSARKYIVQVV